MATPAEQAVIDAAQTLVDGAYMRHSIPAVYVVPIAQMRDLNRTLDVLIERRESPRRITEIGDESGGYD